MKSSQNTGIWHDLIIPSCRIWILEKILWLTKTSLVQRTTFRVILIVRAGVEIEKILMSHFGKQLQKITIVARCKFLVTSLYNVNDAAHSMALSIKFEVWKYSRQKLV